MATTRTRSQISPKAIEITPRNADLFYYRGLARRANREIDMAIADYTHTIELNPRHAAAYDSRSKAFEARGEFERASADHKKAVEIGPP
jgi:tetratricopeptide (TPR) repeat protein